MEHYIAVTKDRHAENRDEERAYHGFVLDSLGLKPGAKQQAVKRRMSAAVAHLIGHPDVRERISNLDDESQVRELARIHEAESSGPDTSPNSDTNEYVRKRTDAIRSGDRKVGHREYRTAIRSLRA